MLTELHQFILAPAKWGKRNQWFEIGPLHVYLRHGMHCIDKVAYPHCLDVAAIEVEEEERGKGHFTGFLEELEKFIDSQAPERLIFVENVLEPRFQAFFRRRPHYRQCNPPDVCFVRVLPLRKENEV